MRQSKIIASCGMTAALSVVIMIIGGVLGLGMYASPMIAGFCLMPIWQKYGAKYAWTLWAAVSLLSFILVPDIEENLMYACLFGPYPILRPFLQAMKKLPRIILKFAYFNIVVVAIEALVTLLLVPEAMTMPLAIALLALGNITFVVYDFLIPRAEIILCHYLKRITSSFK